MGKIPIIWNRYGNNIYETYHRENFSKPCCGIEAEEIEKKYEDLCKDFGLGKDSKIAKNKS